MFNLNDLEFLGGLGMKMIKIPSHEIYNLELVQADVDALKLVLVSTGSVKFFSGSHGM